MNLTRALGSVGGLTLASRVLGLARDMLFAQFVGANFASDAFAVAWRMPNMFRALFAEGAFSAAFIPMFNRKVADPEGPGLEAGIAFADDALSVLLPSLLLMTVLLELFAWPATYLISLGFHGASHDQFAFAVMLTRFTFPYLMLISLASLLGGILNSLHKFWVAAAAPILLNIAQIVALLFFHTHEPLSTARYQAISVTIGGVLQLAWLLQACWASHVRLKVRWPTINEDVKRLLKLIAPAAAGAGAVQFNLLVSTALATGLLPHGSVSYIYYADRLNQLPLGLIGIGLGTVLLPTISHQLGRGADAEAMTTQNRGLELALFFTLPATVALVICGVPIITGLFQHGQFDASDALKTGQALAAFSIGLPSYILVKVLTPGYYARSDTKTPMRYAMISIAINLGLNLALILPLKHVGPPLATALASTVNVWMLYHTLKKRGHFESDARLRRKVPRLAIAAILMGVALYFVTPLISPYLTGSLFRRVGGLIALVASGFAVYAVACLVTGAFVLDDVKLLTKRAREA
ncbi:MAG TPA: murein biosynthesis integral membrane protein MurJ [Sphingomicrobium sp.]|jgi:putative peptidoglycan lipid II flippase|nr:murein biosynthesis integral membrane protein MurJ [Sphingomicrobium sp.]